jgi:hypothetical protein
LSGLGPKGVVVLADLAADPVDGHRCLQALDARCIRHAPSPAVREEDPAALVDVRVSVDPEDRGQASAHVQDSADLVRQDPAACCRDPVKVLRRVRREDRHRGAAVISATRRAKKAR